MPTFKDAIEESPRAVSDVSLLRLYSLRALYLLIAIGLGSEIWPVVLHHRYSPDAMHGVADSLLAALSLLTLLGLRYPLAMLPLLFFETVWKATWLLAFALPLWRAGRMDADVSETAQACLMGAIVPIIIPWKYVFANFVKAPGDRWR
ncbi:MAG: hypothetical protein ACREHE_09290 [Rhizomicrobium sp.]